MIILSVKRRAFAAQGWVCGLSPVEIRVADSGGKEIPCHIDRYNRLDVVDLFDEYTQLIRNAVSILKYRPVPKNRIRVFL